MHFHCFRQQFYGLHEQFVNVLTCTKATVGACGLFPVLLDICSLVSWRRIHLNTHGACGDSHTRSKEIQTIPSYNYLPEQENSNVVCRQLSLAYLHYEGTEKRAARTLSGWCLAYRWGFNTSKSATVILTVSPTSSVRCTWCTWPACLCPLMGSVGLVRNISACLLLTVSFVVWLILFREDSQHRHLFFQHLVDDRSESATSYYEYLLFIQKQVSA